MFYFCCLAPLLLYMDFV
uniref:Uncharacterized protein n=1 Tax=Rhizophora mucronata TaxID=61149 RepID=A0A2P2PLE7_RHIMU